MKKITQFTSLIILFSLLAFAAYLDSPYSFLNKPFTYSASEPVIAQPMDVAETNDNPEVEEKLENVQKVDGYFVETYQEYDVYKDKNGKVTKEVPTSHTDTLKYWDYSQNSGSQDSGQ